MYWLTASFEWAIICVSKDVVMITIIEGTCGWVLFRLSLTWSDVVGIVIPRKIGEPQLVQW